MGCWSCHHCHSELGYMYLATQKNAEALGSGLMLSSLKRFEIQTANAQPARRPDAKLRRALRASPQLGAGCG